MIGVRIGRRNAMLLGFVLMALASLRSTGSSPACACRAAARAGVGQLDASYGERLSAFCRADSRGRRGESSRRCFCCAWRLAARSAIR